MKATLKAFGKSAKRLKKRIFELDPENPEFVFGRSREAQCMILDVNVSRQHAILKFTNQCWNVVDNKVELIWFYFTLFTDSIFLCLSECEWSLHQPKENSTRNTLCASTSRSIVFGSGNDIRMANRIQASKRCY